MENTNLNEQNLNELKETKIETNKTKNIADETQETLISLIPDGLYSADKEYYQPKGKDVVKIEFKIKDNIVEDAKIFSIKVHPESEKYINRVNDALPNLVVGKKLNEIKLPDKISGASTTTRVVQNYLEELKNSKY